jgi:hypothetical protein
LRQRGASTLGLASWDQTGIRIVSALRAALYFRRASVLTAKRKVKAGELRLRDTGKTISCQEWFMEKAVEIRYSAAQWDDGHRAAYAPGETTGAPRREGYQRGKLTIW